MHMDELMSIGGASRPEVMNKGRNTKEYACQTALSQKEGELLTRFSIGCWEGVKTELLFALWFDTSKVKEELVIMG